MNARSRICFIVFALLVLLGLETSAWAVLDSVSPGIPPGLPPVTVSPANGFPLWYKDTSLIQLQPCLDSPTYNAAGIATADPCLIDCITGVNCNPLTFNPHQPIVFPGNFPGEVFYYLATATLDSIGPAKAGRAVLTMALEGTFLNGAPAIGEQITFSRVNIAVGRGLVPFTAYTFATPFGTMTGTTDATGGFAQGHIRDQVGCAAIPCDFTLALGIPAPAPPIRTVGPFLPSVATPAFPKAIPGYTGLFLGDGFAIPGPITAGPGGAAFTITGPNADGAGGNVVTTTAFTVVGKLFAPPPPPCAPVLVNKYYTDILARPADAAGAAAWVAEINRVTGLGMTTKEGLLAVSKFFFNSAEYALRARTNAQYVADLYQTFFSRAPDAAGATFWEGQLTAGLSRNMLLLSFANSPEFGLFVQNACGTTATRPEFDFVNDYYRGFLNRLPDTVGFNGWVAQMKGAQCAAAPASAVSTVSQQIATAFAPNGAEYVARARTDAQFVEDLYDSILRRSADAAGFTAWVNQLVAGTPRTSLLNAFLTAPEFTARVNNVAAAGCVP